MTELDHTFFESHADDVALILRDLAAKWGASEQIDNDFPEDDVKRRVFIGYDYATPETRGYVAATFWIGATGTVVTEREGMRLRLELAPEDAFCGKIQVNFIPDHGEDFNIEGTKPILNSPQELRDLLLVMWNSDRWQMKHDFVEANAELHRQFVGIDGYFKAQAPAVMSILKKIGAAWGGTEQVDNTPESDSKAGGGFLGIGKNQGPKRFFVGYSAPTRITEDSGKQRLTRASIWLDVWQGDKGTIKKSASSRRLELDSKAHKRIQITFPAGENKMCVEGIDKACAASGRELVEILQALWKRDAWGLKS